MLVLALQFSRAASDQWSWGRSRSSPALRCSTGDKFERTPQRGCAPSKRNSDVKQLRVPVVPHRLQAGRGVGMNPERQLTSDRRGSSPTSKTNSRPSSVLLRKEVIQPHLPVRLPCYDFTPIADPTFDGSLPKGWATGFGCYQLSWCDGRCVQGPGTYSPQQC